MLKRLHLKLNAQGLTIKKPACGRLLGDGLGSFLISRNRLKRLATWPEKDGGRLCEASPGPLECGLHHQGA